MAEKRSGKSRRLATGPHRLGAGVREVFTGAHQLRADSGAVCGLDSLGELVERQSSRAQMVAQQDHGLLTLGIGHAIGQVVQLEATLTPNGAREVLAETVTPRRVAADDLDPDQGSPGTRRRDVAAVDPICPPGSRPGSW